MTPFLNAANVDVFLFFQQWVGHSWILDSLIWMAVDNPLVKAALIGCAFMAAWSVATFERSERKRKLLTLTIVAGVVAIGICKLASTTVLSPRPMLMGSGLYVTLDGELSKTKRIPLRQPVDEFGLSNFQDFASGRFDETDLRSFPSDHAALFVALSIGILFAHRGLGLGCIAWTMIVILLPRVMSGMHWPLDVLVGGLVGAFSALLIASVFSKRSLPGFDRLIRWSFRQPAFSAALTFIVVFETCNSFYNVRLVLSFARQLVRSILGSG